MKSARAWASVALLACALAPRAAHALVLGLDPANKTATAATPEPAHDPLRRTTPSGTLTGFLHAVEHSDFVTAARYMQVPESHRGDTEAEARALKALIDRYFSASLTTISDEPTGALDDGLPTDRERIGPLTIGERKVDVTLVRVTDPDVGPIWLISAETLRQAPALYRSLTRTWIERTMPESLVDRSLLGISLAQWILLAAAFVVPFLLLTLLSRVGLALARRFVRHAKWKHEWVAWHLGVQWPTITTLALIAQLVATRFLSLPLTFRIAFVRVGAVVAVLSLAWLLRRVLALGFARAHSLLRGTDRTSVQSLLLLSERLLDAVVIGAGILAILVIAGVDTRAALASLGILGVALALGAQKTIENLLGSVLLLSDRALAVGDQCNVSGRLGWIEDITLRSVRLRTLDDTLVSIPAGVLAQAAIENFTRRRKILARHVLRLRHGTSLAQLTRILDDIRRRLDESTMIEAGSHIRLVDFAAEAIELELFAYVLTTDYLEFLAVREELLLDVSAIIEAAGSAFAMPTQFIYTDRLAHQTAQENAAALTSV
jgi:MscS family membrane protein